MGNGFIYRQIDLHMPEKLKQKKLYRYIKITDGIPSRGHSGRGDVSR